MPDRREEILEAEHRRGSNTITPKGYSQWVLNAMDENGKQMCLELLDYVAKRVSNFWIDDNGIAKFRLSGDEELTREQLFENFL